MQLDDQIVLSRKEKGEVVGGGFFVFRRGKRTGRVGCFFSTVPFEHGSFESAATEAQRMATVNLGETYEVFQSAKVTYLIEKETVAA